MAPFTADAWCGTYYELAMELGPRDDLRLRAALKAVWEQPTLQGCYLLHDVEPERQERVTAESAELAPLSALNGLAKLPGGQVVPCGTVIIREDEGPDWLDLVLPLGGLENAFPDLAAFPFYSPPWRSVLEPLEKWLAEIGREVFRVVPFRLGLIGEEVSGYEYSATLADSGIPSEREIGYLWPETGRLSYYPTNRW